MDASHSLELLQIAYLPERIPPPPHTPALPPEIWLEVFPSLTRTDQQSASLVCSAFRFMAQPMLFEVLDVSPFLLAFTSERPFRRPRRYLYHTLERLACFQQPHIAHGVKVCYISPYTRSGYPSRDRDDDLDPMMVIDAVFRTLPSFPNLKTLVLHLIEINKMIWTTVRNLSLNALWLNSCTMDQVNAIPLPSITHLHLDHCSWKGEPSDLISLHEERRHPVSYDVLQAVLRPQRIQFISTPRRETALTLLEILSQQTTTLQTLRLPFSSTCSHLFLEALNQCPHLTKLSILPPSHGQPRHYGFQEMIFSLPSLTVYEGPNMYLRNLSHLRLQDVSLWGIDERPAFVKPHILLNDLSSFAYGYIASTLEHLHFTVTHISQELLLSLSMFGRLKSLVVESHDSPAQEIGSGESKSSNLRHDHTIGDFYLLIQGISFPPSLENLKFRTRLRSGNDCFRVQEEDAVKFTARLTPRQPSLQRLEIEYGVFWSATCTVVWSRTGPNPARMDRDLPNLGHQLGVNTTKEVTKMSDCFKTIVMSQVRSLPCGNLTFTVQQRRVLTNSRDSSPSGFANAFSATTFERMDTAAALWSRFKNAVVG